MNGYQIVLSYDNTAQKHLSDERKGTDEAIICGRTNSLRGRFGTNSARGRNFTEARHTAYTMLRTLRLIRDNIAVDKLVDVCVIAPDGTKLYILRKDACLPGYCVEDDKIIPEAQLLVDYLLSGEDTWLRILSDMLGDGIGVTFVKNETGLLADDGETERQANAGKVPEPYRFRRSRRRRVPVVG